MTNLPATVIEAEAVANARASVRMIRDDKITFFGLPLSWFDKEDNRRFVREQIKSFAMSSPMAMVDVAKLGSAGWDVADDALRELIIEHHHRSEPMPPPLTTYSMEIAARRDYRRPHGPKKTDTLLRDIALTALVGDVCMKFGLRPTRLTASKKDRPSGCSILAQALKAESMAMSESAVVSIWNRYGRMAFPKRIIKIPA
jgi:hypothetical protein